MTPATQPPRLFTLRLWPAASPDDPTALEWRGKVQSLPDGEAYYFRNWPGMTKYLETMLEAGRPATANSETQDGGTP